MRSFLAFLVAFALCLPAHARHFRWASAGDAATLDPHAQNETFNNGINNLVYEFLTQRDKEYKVVPWLATSWKATSPTTWVVTLRKGVKFHDGSPLTADDVVFSFNRALKSGTAFKLYAGMAGTARRIDDETVEFVTPAPNPIMGETIGTIAIMSKKWCEKNNSLIPQDFKNSENTYPSRNAMGTGPFKLVSFEPGVKTLHTKNTEWWGIKEGWFDGNVDTLEYRPLQNPATRMAALQSGEIDFVLDPSVQDVPRLRQDKALRVWEGEDIRVVFVGFDQDRGELLYSDVKGKNPFKDKRVRRALYQAIDINAIRTQVMRGLSIPTGIPLPDPKGAGASPSLEKRFPYDPAAAKRLLAEAGYPNGFGFTMHCPNDRYVNDEKICVALAGMWARVGVNTKVEAMPKAQYFPKVYKLDVSAFLQGWGGGSPDAIWMLKPVLHSRTASGGGDSNYGNFRNARLDALTDAIETEMDMGKRRRMIDAAVEIEQDEVLVIPLHRQVIPWVSRANVFVVHRRSNVLFPQWVKVQ